MNRELARTIWMVPFGLFVLISNLFVCQYSIVFLSIYWFAVGSSSNWPGQFDWCRLVAKSFPWFHHGHFHDHLSESGFLLHTFLDSMQIAWMIRWRKSGCCQTQHRWSNGSFKGLWSWIWPQPAHKCWPPHSLGLLLAPPPTHFIPTNSIRSPTKLGHKTACAYSIGKQRISNIEISHKSLIINKTLNLALRIH